MGLKTFFKNAFKDMKEVESVCGLGLMIGIKPANKTAAEVLKICMENGVLCLTAKDKIRLLPALNIPMRALEMAVEVIKNAFLA